MKKRNLVILLILFFCVLRLLLFNINTTYSWDEAIYLSFAEGLYDEKGYGYVGNYIVENFRAPLFPYMIYAAYLITGAGDLVAKFLISLISVGSIIILYYVAKKMFNGKIALFSTVFLAANHFHLFFSYRIMTETLAMILITIVFYLFYLIKKDRKFIPLLGFFLGLTFLLKSNLIMIGIIFGFILLGFDRKLLVQTLRSKYLYIGLFIFALTITPWLFYQHKVFGSIFGALVAQRGFGNFPLVPFHYYLLALMVVGFIAPFFIYGCYKAIKKKKKNKIMFYGVVFLVLFFGMQGLMFLSIRYILPFLPILGIISAYGLIQKERYLSIFLIFVILNAAVGYLVIFQYIRPIAGIEKLPEIITRKSYFEANVIRRDAALFIKNSTDQSSTIMANAPAWIWVYTHRNWVPIPKGENEFWNNITAYNIKYIYIEPGKLPDYFQNPKIVTLRETPFIEVYEVKL